MSNLHEVKIHDAIKNIEHDRYILPSIQREFIWKETQICFLFDSLMRGYPISTFQFWELPPDRSKKLDLYYFLKCYDRYKDQHLCKQAPKNWGRGKNLTAVLDGQQRLTALYLGLRGTYYTNPRRNKGGVGLTRGQPKHLHLNLSNEASEEEEDDSLKYEFKFLSKRQITTARNKNETLWFPVRMVSEGEDDSEQWLKIDEWIVEKVHEKEWRSDSERRNAENRAKKIAHKLLKVIRTESKIFHYIVDEESIETALQIFVRLNDQGQKLSKTDLLLSIATVHWDRESPSGAKSAREAVNQLVGELERACPNVKFSKDFVMRAALFVCGNLEVKLKTDYFTHANMLLLQENWEKIHKCLIETAIILSGLRGFEKALASHNSLLPIALFLMTYDLSASNLKKRAKEQISKWLLLSNLKPRVWDGFKHTEVTNMKKYMQEELVSNETKYKSGKKFPLEFLKGFMGEQNSPIDFVDEDYDYLLAKGYSDTETALVLEHIMPMREQTQIDHIVPTVVLKQDALEEQGLSASEAEECVDLGGTLVNLQLLPIDVNTSKQGKFPLDWIQAEQQRNDPNKILTCSTVTNLWPSWPETSEIPGKESVDKIPGFFTARRDLMHQKLTQTLGGENSQQQKDGTDHSSTDPESN